MTQEILVRFAGWREARTILQIQPSTSVEQIRGYTTHLTAARQAPHKCVRGRQTPSGGGAEG